MAARRNGDGGTPKRGHSSRRSYSSSPERSPYTAPSRSPSPRSKRVRKAQETRDPGRARSRDEDHGRDQHRMARDRDRDRDRNWERDIDEGRVRSRERDYGRDRQVTSREERPRDRRGREREPPEWRSQDRARDKRGSRGERGERRVEISPIRSPARSRRDRSHSPQDVQPRRRRSPSRSPSRHQKGSKHDQRTNFGSPAAARDEDEDDAERERNRGEGSPQQDEAVVRMKEVEAALEQKETKKEKPSFEYSGKLAAETNKVKGVTLQFTEPPEARKPNTRWRLYVFKDGEPLNDPLYIHRQTCYLFGRERRVADIPTDHPSCSKQHAVIQYRLTDKDDADGLTTSKVRPYVMDLGSTNGTMLNGERLDPQRYYEMFEKDTIKFGNSSREYVLLHEHSIG